jgi:homoserine dehydrogenase
MKKHLRLGIAGLGTVGCGVVDIIQHNAALLTARTGCTISISAVSARNKHAARDADIAAYAWEDNSVALATREDVDVVLELIGGADGVAYEVCTAALKAGKHVVTANKALIAHHGAALAELAATHNAQLLFEAAVAGGIPIIKMIKQALSANNYGTITAILNGTCNYILSTMEATGRSFNDVLQEAQALGYAEADPAFDVDGIDASHKISILSALAYGTLPNVKDVYAEGIRHITAQDIEAASELGYVIRLIGVTSRTAEGIELYVYPALLPFDHVIAGVNGVDNAVHVTGDAIGELFIKGAGAGREATASAVMSDVLDIARGHYSPVWLQASSTLNQANIIPINTHHAEYYIRLCVADEAGVLAKIASVFAQHTISVASLLQHSHDEHGNAHITITTHEAREDNITAALSAINSHSTTMKPPRFIRIARS